MVGWWCDRLSKTITLLLFVLICNPYSLLLVCSWTTRDCNSTSVSANRSTSSVNHRSLIITPCTLTLLAAVLHSVGSMIRSSSEINDSGEIGSPCLVPCCAVNHSPNVAPIYTARWDCAYRFRSKLVSFFLVLQNYEGLPRAPRAILNWMLWCSPQSSYMYICT